MANEWYILHYVVITIIITIENGPPELSYFSVIYINFYGCDGFLIYSAGQKFRTFKLEFFASLPGEDR